MKLIVLLDQYQPDVYRFLLRATVPAARQSFYAQAGAVSIYQDPDSATRTADNAAVAAGQVVEQLGQMSTAGRTIAQIETDLQNQQATFQAQTNATNKNNPWLHYGTSWDGTTWTPVTIA